MDLNLGPAWISIRALHGSQTEHMGPAPGQPHWQNGAADRTARAAYEASDTDLTERGCAGEAVAAGAALAHNARTGRSCSSPMQWALGRNPHNAGSIVGGEDGREVGGYHPAAGERGRRG